MEHNQEQFERTERAARLVEARKRAKIGGVKLTSAAFGWNVNNYKAHESGRNGFGITDAKKYAKAFKVSLNWLFFGTGTPEDIDPEIPSVVDVPLISWISAGQLGEQDGLSDFSDFPTIQAIDLPEGDWIALRVVGDSMNKISPPESIIFANRRDRRLVSNGCYVVADETGAATYKRYRPNDLPPFQPASYDENIEPPDFQGSVTVIGRVRRSIINM
ncbi:S24 family peptidase [Rhizobium sp. 9140]|uniref:S24 family peptidase n=1 Tax=Rhizobium sp. 9140 TaxID=1761900 RepID=UPI00079679A3|nr:S24 family peptidase [Rhizobium sp. 9140]CZT36159.1 SOS-response transcriptional repressor LexA (RecA-mediated autopeptidase) [Rhizobium sp. 9140]